MAGLTGGTGEVTVAGRVAFVVQANRAFGALEVEEADRIGRRAKRGDAHQTIITLVVVRAAAFTRGAGFFFRSAHAAVVAAEAGADGYAIFISRAGAGMNAQAGFVTFFDGTVSVGTFVVTSTGRNLFAVADGIGVVTVSVEVVPILTATAGVEAAIWVVDVTTAAWRGASFYTGAPSGSVSEAGLLSPRAIGGGVAVAHLAGNTNGTTWLLWGSIIACTPIGTVSRVPTATSAGAVAIPAWPSFAVVTKGDPTSGEEERDEDRCRDEK